MISPSTLNDTDLNNLRCGTQGGEVGRSRAMMISPSTLNENDANNITLTENSLSLPPLQSTNHGGPLRTPEHSRTSLRCTDESVGQEQEKGREEKKERERDREIRREREREGEWQ
jgi:hypothetical protein